LRLSNEIVITGKTQETKTNNDNIILTLGNITWKLSLVHVKQKRNKLLQTKLKRDRWFTIYKELSWTRETFMVVKSNSVFI